jgi:PhzF family phenazine biosynthesis protein
MKLPFLQIDAFADRPFSGNPAAVIPLERWPEDALLQQIAQENNLSETAFFVADPTGEADFELRWFSPTAEVALCGHGTLASGHAILGTAPCRSRVTFRTRKAGILAVARDGAGYKIALPAWKPEPRPLPSIVAALGLGEVVETLWHPHRYALVIVESEDIVRGLAPDFRALATEGNILAIVSARGRETDIVSRAFAPGAGVDEDPVTGSAHAVAVPYWAETLGRTEFCAWQSSARGGRLGCRLEGERVILSGRCVTVIEGILLLSGN